MNIYRVQDKHGRGPWRPGMSSRWIDMRSTRPLLPPIFDELPEFILLVNDAHKRGLHVGCAVRSDRLEDWFLQSEITALRLLGFRLVQCEGCELLAETANQSLIASPKPLSELPRVQWASVLALPPRKLYNRRNDMSSSDIVERVARAIADAPWHVGQGWQICADMARAAIASIHEWQPIGTYDKERGSVVVVLDWYRYHADPDRRLHPVRYIAGWNTENNAWVDDDGMDLDIDPTHWLPLPDTSTVSAGAR